MKRIIAVLSFSFFILTGCNSNSNTIEQSNKNQTSVRCESVSSEAFSTQMELSGTLFPSNITPIFIPKNVGIKSINVKDGQVVKKGQLLVQYDTDLLGKKVKLLNEQITNISNELNEISSKKEKSRWYSGVFSNNTEEAKKEYKDIKKEALDMKLSELKALRLDAAELLSKQNMIAPYDGSVLMASNGLTGAMLPKDAAGAIIQTDPLIGKFLVNQFQLQKIKENQYVSIKVDGVEQFFTSKIDNVSPTSIPNTQLFEVVVKVDNHGNLLKPGMFAEAAVTTSTSHEAITIPVEAVNYVNNETYVFVANHNKAEKTLVTLGERNENRVEVLSGLKEGLLVITDGKDYLSPGDLIMIQGK